MLEEIRTQEVLDEVLEDLQVLKKVRLVLSLPFEYRSLIEQEISAAGR
jgi:hypothetical protein